MEKYAQTHIGIEFLRAFLHRAGRGQSRPKSCTNNGFPPWADPALRQLGAACNTVTAASMIASPIENTANLFGQAPSNSEARLDGGQTKAGSNCLSS